MAAVKKGGISDDALRIVSAGAVYGLFSVIANFLFIDILLYPLIMASLKGAALPGSFSFISSSPLNSIAFTLLSGIFYAAAYFFVNPLMPGRSGFSKGLYFGIFVWLMALVPFLVLLYSISQFFAGSVALWFFDLLVRNIIGCGAMAWYLEKR